MRLHDFGEERVHGDDRLQLIKVVLETHLIVDHQNVHVFFAAEELPLLHRLTMYRSQANFWACCIIIETWFASVRSPVAGQSQAGDFGHARSY